MTNASRGEEVWKMKMKKFDKRETKVVEYKQRIKKKPNLPKYWMKYNPLKDEEAVRS